MNSAVERVRAAFERQDQGPLVRGELWIGKRPFQELRMHDNLEGHLRLRNRLGMDLLFLPLLIPDFSSTHMDYRRFSVAEIAEAVKISDLFVGIVVDGPFQRSVEKQGLVPLFSQLKDDEKAVARRFEEEASDMKVGIEKCLELNVGAVVVADDLAFQQSTYISPDDSGRLLGPLYADTVQRIHASKAYALFHSCGNIRALLPQLVACGFDGLAACQDQCLDLVSIKKEYGSRLTFLGGMDADILEAEFLTESHKTAFGRKVLLLSQGGGFILGSSCGVSSPNSLQRLQELYAIAEEHLAG